MEGTRRNGLFDGLCGCPLNAFYFLLIGKVVVIKFSNCQSHLSKTQIIMCYCVHRNEIDRTRKMVQRSGALAALAEDPDLIPSTHTVVHSCP